MDLISVYKSVGSTFRYEVSSMNLTGDMTYRFTASTALCLQNSYNSHCTATRITKVYWGLESFHLFLYRNTQSCCVGIETIKKLG
jgi:hypothetical protein